jgi:ATP-binding cassette subfamily F protein 3
MLQIVNLTYRVGGRVLFDRASLALPTGHRAGLIGRNGSGKSTLLRLIVGDGHADGGDIQLPNRWRVALVAQDAPDGPESLLDTVLAADRERTDLLAEAETATDPHRIGDIHTRLADKAAHRAPARAASILAGLGFDEAAQAGSCHSLSGGWRMRVALAATLFAEPDLLLLDEPTNHLDLEATLWLESYLKTYPGTVLMVSHDRDLLNRAVNRIVSVEDCKLVSYSGGYDDFERIRSERLEHQASARTKQLLQRRHMQSYIDRFRYKASKARQAQSRLKALARMAPIAAVSEDRTVAFNFPDADALPSPLIAIERASVGYEAERPILDNLNLSLDADDRIALLGANGNGKSTLMRLLAGRLKVASGELRRSPKLRIGYFAQHQAEELDLDATPLMHLERLSSLVTIERQRAQLARFGIGAQLVESRVSTLSGGEKARLLFALMSRNAPHLLLLDEPTNHLDVDARQALAQAINDFSGAVVLISHDPHLIELTTERLWLVSEGGCRPFDGDLDDYRALLLGKRRGQSATAEPTAPSPNRRDGRRAAAQARAALAPLRRAVTDTEAHLTKLQARRVALQSRLADQGLYDQPPEKVTELRMSLAQLEKEIAAAEVSWFAAQKAIETANA